MIKLLGLFGYIPLYVGDDGRRTAVVARQNLVN